MIRLNYRDARPIYEQVRDGLRHLVVTGAISQGEAFPSVRAMAASLAINPNTIQRAYAELEAEGFIYSVPGKGSFAARRLGAGEAHAARRAALMERLRELIAELRYLNVTDGEIIALMNEGVAQ